ncbi:glycosyltransferase family 4 protein [Opitutia bacterium ISCC 51]|nr:glycosyltransferase family 4 protein [Opitutae bacterium ISCC 51]QXD27007.1 glycosyltransferase family 4 protein [Opitutae bacterium ISCC 52]
MNILFVHHGAITANSMNHIGPFADELDKQGHQTIVAVPELDPTLKFFPYPRIKLQSFEELLKSPCCFEGSPPDIVHAWTPREIVRQFCEQLWQRIESRWIIHLEDDESAVREATEMSREDVLHRTDPLHGPWFMEFADGYTLILDRLARDLPPEKLFQTLYPGFDLQAFRRNPEPALSRETFSIPDNFKIISYPGAASGANSEDLLDLFTAIHLLNEHGTPCVLLKTGFPDIRVRKQLPEGAENWIRDVGYLPREQMWRLIELADVVVQPGRQNDYNEYRLPSKLPDFLCIGKPLVTSTTNLGRKLKDGEEALLLEESTAEEIAARCQELFSNPDLAQNLAKGGKEKGRDWFNLSKNTESLVEYYQRILETPQNPLSEPPGNQIDKALELLESELSTIQKPSEEVLQIRGYLQEVCLNRDTKQLKLSKPPPITIELQVYYPHDPDKLEFSSIRRSHGLKTEQHCMIPFSPKESMDWLRIDPGQYPGTYLIKSWALLDEHQKPLLVWTPQSAYKILCQANGATLGPISDEGQEIWSLTHDPQLLFAPLPKIETAKIRWLRLEFSAKEVESPLTTQLKLRRKSIDQQGEEEAKRNARMDILLNKLERRHSLVLRFIDRIRNR